MQSCFVRVNYYSFSFPAVFSVVSAGLLETKHVPYDKCHTMTETHDFDRICVFSADRLCE